MSNNPVLIREVSFGERALHTFVVLQAAKNVCPLLRYILSRECRLREQPLHCILKLFSQC